LALHPLFRLLRDLEASSIHYTLARDRSDTIRVSVTFVGERVEVDVFEDGHIEVSRFHGSEGIVGDVALIERLIGERSVVNAVSGGNARTEKLPDEPLPMPDR
jgi:hypothetical protein